jgi:hypothetical protein
MFYDISLLEGNIVKLVSEEAFSFDDARVLYADIMELEKNLAELKGGLREVTQEKLVEHLNSTGEKAIKAGGGKIALIQQKPKKVLNEQKWMQAVLASSKLSELMAKANVAEMQFNSIQAELKQNQEIGRAHV